MNIMDVCCISTIFCENLNNYTFRMNENFFVVFLGFAFVGGLLYLVGHILFPSSSGF